MKKAILYTVAAIGTFAVGVFVGYKKHNEIKKAVDDAKAKIEEKEAEARIEEVAEEVADTVAK